MGDGWDIWWPFGGRVGGVCGWDGLSASFSKR